MFSFRTTALEDQLDKALLDGRVLLHPELLGHGARKVYVRSVHGAREPEGSVQPYGGGADSGNEPYLV